MKKDKYELFMQDFSNEKKFELNLEKLFSYIFKNIFQNILNLPRIDFINSLTSTVKAILEEQYSNEIYSNEKFFSLFLSIGKHFENKYNEYNQILNLSWDNYQNKIINLKEEEIDKFKLTSFKKHCKKTQEYAIHNCNKKEKGNFIVVFDKNNKDAIKFIICKNCRKSYYIDLFLNYCQNCNCNYYCGLMGPKEDPNFLPATFNPPHCELIANDKIQCTKCKGAFYYNMKENYLQCINNSCKYKISPNLANFKCNICSTYFRTDIKIYNNFELIYIRKIISISLLIKEKANPGILPCCKNLELNDLVFYHKKECRGSLYFWILNKKIIVICEKCKAINYFSRFIWTCPNCGLHFKTKKEEIEEKLKKNLFNNLKSKLDINILLGDEILESHYLLQQNYSQIKLKADLKRKKPLREILEKKRKGLYKNDYKEKLRNKKIEFEEKKIINDSHIDNLIYKSNSIIKSDLKFNLKKKKNYLFEKLLRNQFLSKRKISHVDKDIIKKLNSEGFYSEQKNYGKEKDKIIKQNKMISSERKFIKFRGKSEINLFRKDSNNKKIETNMNIISERNQRRLKVKRKKPIVE